MEYIQRLVYRFIQYLFFIIIGGVFNFLFKYIFNLNVLNTWLLINVYGNSFIRWFFFYVKRFIIIMKVEKNSYCIIQ